jgi:hypothetical protein
MPGNDTDGKMQENHKQSADSMIKIWVSYLQFPPTKLLISQDLDVDDLKGAIIKAYDLKIVKGVTNLFLNQELLNPANAILNCLKVLIFGGSAEVKEFFCNSPAPLVLARFYGYSFYLRPTT